MDKGKKGIAGISIIATISATGLKLSIWYLTVSLGIMSEAPHSGLTLLAAAITYFPLRI